MLRDDRLADRLRGGTAGADLGDEDHPEPKHVEPCSISQAAACAALTGDQAVRRQDVRRFKSVTSACCTRLQRHPWLRCPPAHGAFYMFPNVEAAMRVKGAASDVAFCEQLLEATDVAVVPGSAFGAPGHLRMSFAASAETLDDALQRIERFMRH